MSIELAKRNLLNNEPMLILEHCKDDLSRWFVKVIYDLQEDTFNQSCRIDELETTLQDLLDKHKDSNFMHPADAFLIKEVLEDA